MVKRVDIRDDVFNPIKVRRSFLGIEEGTILKFDAASGKYVSMGGHEDIGEGEYYYSGFAVALDPYLIQDNINGDDDDIFEVLPLKEKKKKKPLRVVEESPTKEELKAEFPDMPAEVEAKEPEPVVKEEVKEPVPNEIPEGDLSFVCGLCHAVTFVHKIKYGLFFPVAPGTRLHLKCSNCGIETEVYYVMGDEPNKESK